jgi:molybdopterin/thiamine biosynthesis adenylyltransferase
LSFDRSYFARQLVLEGIGTTGQSKLAGSSVLIAGLGGTGSFVAMELALAGVGEITLLDRDVVSLENLHRQPIYTLDDVGKSKAEVAASYISGRAPSANVRYRAENIDERNAATILGKADLAVDCLDNLPARRALNSACVKGDVPLVHTGAIGWEVSEGVFWSPRTACLECLFPRPPRGADPEAWDAVPSCEQVGTLGAVTGLAASLGAIDAIMLLTGGVPASLGRLLVWDGRRADPHSVSVKRREDCEACGKPATQGTRSMGGRAKGPQKVVIELCGGHEFFVGDAFSPKAFAGIGKRLGDRGSKKGNSIIMTRQGEAEISLFRTGGVLIKGVSSPEEARAALKALDVEL